MTEHLGLTYYKINDTPSTRKEADEIGNSIIGLEFVNVSWTGNGWRGQVQFPLFGPVYQNSGWVTLEKGDVTEYPGRFGDDWVAENYSSRKG